MGALPLVAGKAGVRSVAFNRVLPRAGRVRAGVSAVSGGIPSPVASGVTLPPAAPGGAASPEGAWPPVAAEGVVPVVEHEAARLSTHSGDAG
ncbi:hypothetical protein ACE1SV_23190 [Streptomyces sennicomposti]